MNKQLLRVINAGKPAEVIKNLAKAELLKQDKATWNNEMQEGYDLLFPMYREMTYDEYLVSNLDEEPVAEAEFDSVFRVDTRVEIDYSQDENYVTFTDWLNETIVITEAIEATYDEDGMVLTEAVPEVVELVREFVAPEVTEDMLDAYLNTNDGYLKYLKSESNKIIESMTVTISSGKEFDANELARVNMMSAVISSEFAGLTETSWRLANNETTVVTLNELKEAVMLALVKFGQLKGIV